MAAVVAFCTVYALILPAVTLEKTNEILACPFSVHQHTDVCWNENGELICGQADFVVHKHEENCYDGEGKLVCSLAEIPEHEHTETCYLSCDNPAVLHSHSESCYDDSGNLICGQLEVLEHQHENGCFVKPEESNESGESNEEEESNESEESDELNEEEIDVDVSEDALTVVGAETDIMPFAVGDSQSVATELIRLFKYAEDTEGADVAISIRTSDGTVIKPNEDGSYDVRQGEEYTVRVTFTSKNKLEPGRYYVQFPVSERRDLTKQGGTLELKANDNTTVDVGSWYFSSEEGQEGWLIFDVNESISQVSNITLLADVKFAFDSVQEGLPFDGFIQVNVKPDDKVEHTEISKWARRNVTDAAPDKIYWEVEIDGNRNSSIVGSTFYDTITTPDTHYYTESDMANGIKIEAYNYGNASTSTEPIDEHSWTITSGDSGLQWTENGWSYTMPESVLCSWCGKTFTPGGDGWLYYLKYTSTVKQDGTGGYVSYENRVAFDGDEATGKTQAGEVGSTATIVKSGQYNSGDAPDSYSDDTITWTITATIPGAKSGQKYDYFWHLWDGMSVKDGTTDKGYYNDLNNATVVAVVGGQTYQVPEKKQATDEDRFYWVCSYSEESERGNGIWSGREIDLYSRCTCTEETCADWADGKCAHKDSKGFCRCWCFTENVILTFTYETKAGPLVDQYGGKDAKLYNYIELDNQQRNSNNEWKNVRIDHDSDQVTIPGVFTKGRTQEPDADNGYLVEYTITVNEMMADLAVGNDEVKIVDTMSKTLNFKKDTLKVTTTDVDGNVKTLIPDDDYTVDYDSTTHVATIVLRKTALGPYQYTLIYDASIHLEAGETQYENQASIDLFGKTYATEPTAYEAPHALISGEKYSVKLQKYDASDETKKLEGATFGLFTVSSGRLVAKMTTDGEGIGKIETDTSQDIILENHVLYFLQELEAPPGYKKDSSAQHYLIFCNNDLLSGDEECHQIDALAKAARLTDEQKANITVVYTFRETNGVDFHISNAPIDYILPETGGTGTTPFVIGGTLLILIAVTFYIIYFSRKERN